MGTLLEKERDYGDKLYKGKRKDKKKKKEKRIN